MSDHGRHVWFDLMTPDPKGGAAFYRQLLGYGQQAWDEGDYDMFTVEGQTVGGVMKSHEGSPPHWIGYVAVDDLDAAVARVSELGGTVMVPATEIPNTGRFSICADPQGAAFAMYSHDGEPGPDRARPRVGDVAWVELMTTDHEAGLAFYRELFGWRDTESMDMGGGWMYQMFGLERTVGGAMTMKADDGPVQPAWLYYLHVDDADAACAKATELGATVVNGPMEVPGGDRVAQLMDPQGAMFAVHSSAG